MSQLNLPIYNFQIKNQKDKRYIFDNQRKKYVRLTPEEWVRQHFIRFLIEEKGYPASYIAVEKELKMNGLHKRCDAILYNQEAQPILILEFKAPHVPLSQQTFDQVAVYNSKLHVDYLIITNGMEHFCCYVNRVNAHYSFFEDIPTYQTLINNLQAFK
jgi:hypothetical protein